MAVDPRVRRLIIQRARKYKIDPQAALAVAAGEGGIRWGAVGDNGTSFGPFQLHVGGALPKGKDAKWANSPAGIDYAIRKMAESGAAGLKGKAAVDVIVRKFERPADPDTSVANAIARLGKIPAPKPTNAGLTIPQPKPPAGNLANALPPQVHGTLNDIFRKVGLQPLDIVGDLPLPATSVPGLPAVPKTSTAKAAPAQPLKVAKMPRVQRMVGLIEYAQQLGLSVRENPYTDKVDPVHTKKSHHYQTIGKHKGKKVGRAIDVSGDPKAMLKFFQYASRFPGIDDVFHDPAGYSIDRGKRWDKTIGGHSSHVHASIR